MSTLIWIKSTANDWLMFETFGNLSQVKTTGVYIIWHGGNSPKVECAHLIGPHF